MMAAMRAACATRMLAPAILILSLSVFFGTTLLRGRRSEWEGRSFRSLRVRANSLFSQKKYSEAADLYESGYRQALASHDPVSALRFLNNLGATQFGLLRYRRAIDAFVRARDLARSMNDRGALSATCANLCSLYSQIGDMEAATIAAEQGL